MARKKAKVTLEDVASLADVSVATVHRVINEVDSVNDELGQRVQQAIKELGFTPKRSRTRAKPPVVTMIVPEFLDPSNTMIMAGAQEEAARLNVRLVILPVNEKPDNQKENLIQLKQMTVDAIVLLHLQITPSEVFELCRQTPLPLVQLGVISDVPDVHCIDMDRESGMYQATKYLIGLGHTRLAYISGPLELSYSETRLHGITRALNEAGLSLSSDFHRWCLPTIEEGFHAAGNLLQLPKNQRPSAILTFNDLIAIGALHAARTAGLVVPKDLSIIGSGNILFTVHTNPPLTTIDQHKYQMGQLAIQKLYRYLGGYASEHKGTTLLECPLVVRESTGPCPQ